MQELQLNNNFVDICRYFWNNECEQWGHMDLITYKDICLNVKG